MICPHCEKDTPVPDVYDTDNFIGQLRCKKCGILLHIRLWEGKCTEAWVDFSLVTQE